MPAPAEGLCLAIETSCDETAAAVVAGGRRVLSSVVASQAGLHARYGGVVPELAARHHLEAVLPVVAEALRQAGASWADLRLLAVTRGPGLPAALLVGVAAAKALAFARGLPLVGVNHLAGHVYAHRLDPDAGAGGGAQGPADLPRGADGLPRPAVCLVVSGSHTDVCLLPAGGGLRLLGSTVDDAAGEAFDKVARLLGLGYPGGARLDALARGGNPRAVAFPRTLRPLAGPRATASRASATPGPFAFSFSGLKTAVAQHLALRAGADAAARGERQVATPPGPRAGGREASGAGGSGDPGGLDPAEVADIAASFQAAVVEVLVERTVRAAEVHAVRVLLACGGVAANSGLRAALGEAAAAHGWGWAVPPPRYCTDNAAMIGAAGWVVHQAGRADGWDMDADPNLPLEL